MVGWDARMSGRVLGRGMIRGGVFKRLTSYIGQRKMNPSVPIVRKIAGEGTLTAKI